MAKVCKFYKQQKQVSYDGGVTWQNLNEYRMGDLYERNSADCGGGGALYRTVELETCIFTDKFRYMQEQVSYDGGSTWENTENASAYTCIETDANDCGWTMPDMTGLKKYAVYSKYDNYGHNCWPGVYSVVVPTGFYTATTACDGTTAQTGTASSATNGLHTLIFGECGSDVVISQEELGYKTGHDTCTMAYGDMGNPYPNVIFSSKVTELGVAACVRSHFNKLRWETEPSNIVIGEYALSGTVIDNLTMPQNITRVGAFAFAGANVGSAITFNHKVSLGDSIWGESSVKTLTFNAGAATIYGTNVDKPFRYTSVEKIILNGLKADYDYEFTDFTGILVDNRIEGGLKYRGSYSNGDTLTIGCNGSSTLSSSETKNSSYDSSLLTSAQIGDCVSVIGDNAFDSCGSLTSVTIPSSVTEIKGRAFQSCTGLTSFTVPDGVTKITGELAFFGCRSLRSLTLSNNLQSIGAGAFGVCTSLTGLTIPASVTSIDGRAFIGCTGLQSITMKSTTPPALGAEALDDTNNCTIYVPIAGAQAYLTNNDWSPYRTRIEPVGQN